MTSQPWTTSAEAAFWYAVWLVVSPMLLFNIKSLLSDPKLEFGYSFGFLGWSNLVTWLVAQLVISAVTAFGHDESMGIVEGYERVSWAKGSILGALQAFEVGLGAKMIKELSVTLGTEIGMTMPLLQYLGGLCLGMERLDARLMLSLFVMLLGSYLAIQGTRASQATESKANNLLMVLVCLGGSAFTVMRWGLTQRWLAPRNPGEARPSTILMLCRMSPASGAIGLLVAAFIEPQMYTHLLKLPHPTEVVCRLLIIGIFVVCMISAELRGVQLSSALTFAVLKPAHYISVIIIDHYYAGTRLTAMARAGIALSFCATLAYAAMRQLPASRQEYKVLQGTEHHLA